MRAGAKFKKEASTEIVDNIQERQNKKKVKSILKTTKTE